MKSDTSNNGSGARLRHYCPGGRESGGGIGRLVGYVVDEAARRGERHLVCDTRGRRWQIPGSILRLLGAMAILASDRLLAPERIHHIHVAGRGSTARKLILTFVARSLGCRHILHLHDYDYGADLSRRSPRRQRWVARMFRGADRVIVLGLRDRDTVVERLGVARDKVVVMHNAVPDPGPKPAQGRDVPLILFLGQLSQRKGVPELLTALASPELAGRDWRAVLAGDGPVAEYRAMAAALDLGDRVEMPGWLAEPDVRALCASADILVLPSHAEGLAMAVIEGLAHGLAVVTTRVGAHEEALTDGVTCSFVPVGDAKALAGALERLVTDPAGRRRLGSQGRALFLSRYSIDAYFGQLDRVLDEISLRGRSLVGAE
ncbi:glycosyltransferase family 4 protein [Paracoccaceae bacterium Fryx2]|nr:glycosyltransferase family 4 protein [Paracoccaceae bacterium Fryx2]